MSRVFVGVVGLIMAIGLLSACQSASSRSAGTAIDDSAITASVKAKLVADKPANLTRVDVDTNRGTVYLKGAVDTAEQKARAEQLAWQANGVKTVVNNLQVVPNR